MEESLGGNSKILARILNPGSYGYHEALGTTRPLALFLFFEMIMDSVFTYY